MTQAGVKGKELGPFQMDLRALGYLDLIVRSGSYLKAAAAMDLTQPALSKAITQLEKQCGLKLLQRGRRGVNVQPTVAGELVLKTSRVMFEERAKLTEQLRCLVAYQSAGNADPGSPSDFNPA